jgi:hypothetical protein
MNPLCHDQTCCTRPGTRLAPVVTADERQLRGVVLLCDFHYLRPGVPVPLCPCRWCQQGLTSLCEEVAL